MPATIDVGAVLEKMKPARLQQIAAAKRGAFSAAQPFPHIGIDGLVPQQWLENVAREIPEHKLKYSHAKIGTPNAREFKKQNLDSDQELGPFLRATFAMLRSSAWVKFLEQLTGVYGLIADPH